jgi:signal transduction histidine kinase
LKRDLVQITDAELQQRRDAIQSGLRRVNTLIVGILCLVTALALTALIQTRRVERETQRTLEATHRAEALRVGQEKLRASQLAQAQAWRRSGSWMQRAKALELLESAARFRPDRDLRDEALAWLVVTVPEESELLKLRIPIVNVAFDLNLERVALAWDELKVHIFDLAQKNEVAQLPGAPGPGWLKFSPDGRWLTGRHYDGRCTLWDVDKRTIARRLFAGAGIFTGESYDFSPDSLQFAAAGLNQGLTIYQLREGTEQPIGITNKVYSIRYSPDGRQLVLTSKTMVLVVDLEQRAVTGTLATQFPADWAVWHPHGGWIVVSGHSSKMVLWHPATGVTHLLDNVETNVKTTRFTPDGLRLVVSGVDNTISEWDLATRRRILKFEGAQSDHFNSNGRQLSFIRPNLGYGHLTFPEQREHYSVPGLLVPYGDAAWLDDDLLVTVNETGVQVFDAATRRETQHIPLPGARTVRLGPDAKSLWVKTDGLVYMCDLVNAPVGSARALKEPRPLPDAAEAADPVGRGPGLFAQAAATSTVELLYPGVSGAAATLAWEGMGEVARVCLSPGSRRLCAVSRTGNVHLWDLALMRRQLAAINLDFHQPMSAARSLVPAATGQAMPAARSLLFVTWSGTLLAIFLGLLALRRYRKLVENYFQLDALVMQRNGQLAEAREELFHSQKMQALGTLAAGIAHDFNNLLSIIRMSNKLIAREGKDAAIQENTLEIEQAVRQGKDVVRSMLGYSREPDDTGQPYQAADLVEGVVALLGRQFLSGITLTLNLEPALPLLKVPKGRLEQILLNLIVNASEAMAGAGKLEIGLRSAPKTGGHYLLHPRAAAQHVELLVADSGPGIPPEVLPRIFEPFFTTKNVGAARGTGLGLSMVHSIAQQEGMGLMVESAPGEGVTFRVIIPV